ncbi:MAG: hypothetical protein ACYSWU_25730 [Planctomycetota bacterium]|jgi:hypothetical protein
MKTEVPKTRLEIHDTGIAPNRALRIFKEMAIIQQQMQFIRSPRIAIAQLASDPAAAFVGFRHVLFLALLWEFALVLWILGGATVTMPAFLKIPDEQYYFYQLIFFVPMFLVTWLLAGGVAYVLAKAFGGTGSYDTILGGFGMTAAVSGYFVLIPDYVQGLLWTTGWVPFTEYQELTGQGFLAVLVWSYIIAYSIAYLLLYSTTIHYSQNLSKSKSVIVAIIAYFVSAVFFIIICR